MSKPGHIDDAGRQYFRCGECGDSSNPNKAHAFCDRMGKTWCYRCEHRGELSLEAMIALALGEVGSVEEALAFEVPDLSQLQTIDSGRPTLLTKYDNGDYEGFPMRESNGKIIGWHKRDKYSKHFHNEGKRGINWYGSEAGYQLTSCPASPITLVEGVYDCIDPSYVSAHGTVSYRTLSQLRFHDVIVYPDPDVIESKQGRRRLVRALELANNNLCFVQGIMCGNDDPDKATEKVFVPLKEAISFVRSEASV